MNTNVIINEVAIELLVRDHIEMCKLRDWNSKSLCSFDVHEDEGMIKIEILNRKISDELMTFCVNKKEFEEKVRNHTNIV